MRRYYLTKRTNKIILFQPKLELRNLEFYNNYFFNIHNYSWCRKIHKDYDYIFLNSRNGIFCKLIKSERY